MEKVHALEENASGQRALPYGTEESEKSLMDYSWVFDELAEEVDSKMDPNYTLPQERARGRCTTGYEAAEEVGENSITASLSLGRKYNLRPRK